MISGLVIYLGECVLRLQQNCREFLGTSFYIHQKCFGLLIIALLRE